jgi:hypothetical protein
MNIGDSVCTPAHSLIVTEKRYPSLVLAFVYMLQVLCGLEVNRLCYTNLHNMKCNFIFVNNIVYKAVYYN